MRRFFGKALFPGRSPDTGFWTTGGARNRLQNQHAQSCLDFEHPLVGDPQDPNPNGTSNIKWQATSGQGDFTNPSKPVDSVRK